MLDIIIGVGIGVLFGYLTDLGLNPVITFIVLAGGFVFYLRFTSNDRPEKPAPQQTYHYSPPVTLDDSEITNLGSKAAEWCRRWMYDTTADHKWLVIEISRFKMDCRSLKNTPPFAGYPHCTIEFSKEISEQSRKGICDRILEIIYSQCPEMITKYGLYRDGGDLILPTNSE